MGVRTTFLIENSVVEQRNGDLLMLFRTHDTGFLYSATSSNKGYDWTEPEPTELQNPDSKAQVKPETLNPQPSTLKPLTQNIGLRNGQNAVKNSFKVVKERLQMV